jgi:hypothetical protein
MPYNTVIKLIKAMSRFVDAEHYRVIESASKWQIATGFDLSKYNHYGLYQLSTNTLKYGISEFLEARMDFGLQYDPEQKIYGTNSTSFGIKTLLMNKNKFLPKTAFIIEFYPPPFSSTQQSLGLATEFCFSHNFKNGNNLYYNIGATWQAVKSSPIINSLIGFSYEIIEKISAFLELYFYKNPEIKMNYVSDIGFTYQLNSKLQIDFACGLDLVNPRGNFYFDGGLSYNF